MVAKFVDLETAEIAIRAALTGTWFSHAAHQRRADAFTRLIDMGIEPFLVASSSKRPGPRLVRTICPHCKAEKKVERSYLKKLVFHPRNHTARFWTGSVARSAANSAIRDDSGFTRCCSLTKRSAPDPASRSGLDDRRKAVEEACARCAPTDEQSQSRV